MKQWKRLAALSSAIVMAAATLTYFPSDTLQNIRWEISASADETSAVTWTKTESDGLTWTLTADGKLTISGTGAMKDYNAAENLSPAYMNSNVKKVVIEDGVTSIGELAFYKCISLTNITIPDSVTCIEYAAFHGCSSLSSITIPNSVTSIGIYAFVVCSSLTSITIPDGVTSIGYGAFSDCSSLKTISLSCKSSLKKSDFGEQADLVSYTNQHLLTKTAAKAATCTESGNKKYWTCKHCGKYFLSDDTNPATATAVELSETVIPALNHKNAITRGASEPTETEPGYSGDRYCPDCDTVFEKGYTYWNEDNLTWKLDADGTLTISGTGAMKNYKDGDQSPVFNNSNVKKVVIEDGVTSIGNYAFSYTGLKSITIPDSVTSIGNYAFSYTDLKSITIPDSVTSIGNYAFAYCKNLPSITIPDGVTSIGYGAFYHCTSLTSITIPDRVTSIGFSAFSGCKNLTSITIPDSIISIGHTAFYNCSSLTSITIPDSVISIGDAAFKYCSNLKTISLSCKSTLKRSDFGDKADLVSYASHTLKKTAAKAKTCTEDGNKEYWTCEHCGKYFLSDDTNPETAKAVEQAETIIPASHKLTKVKEEKAPTCTEDGNKEYWTCEHCGKYFLSDDANPETAKAVEQSECMIPAIQHKNATTRGALEPTETAPGYSGDRYCPDCDKVVEKGYTYWIEGNLTWKLYEDGTLTISGTGAMKDYDYYNNPSPASQKKDSVKKVVIEDGVTSIRNSAFYDCNSLTSITIPNSVTSIGAYAFSNCYYLTNITIPNSVTSIENYAFRSCSSLTSITIPDSVTSIGELAFYSCDSLTSITISNSVTSIGERAFAYCSSLTSITIPDSVTSIGEAAFAGCSSLTSITIPDSVTSIGEYAFQSCSSLTSITIPDSVTSIGDYVFISCSSLTTISLSCKSSLKRSDFGKQADLVSYTSHTLNKTEAKAATCTENGNKEYWTCEHCKKYFLSDDANPETAKAVEQSETVIPALKHKNATTRGAVKPTETAPGYSGDRYCPDCDTVFEKGYTYWNEGNLTWKLYEDGTLNISGTGAMKNYNNTDNLSPVHMNSSVKKIVIEEGVTSIGESAFENCSLTSITIPKSVTSIGDDAFYNCSSLTSITIPKNVTSIGNSVFENCSSLTDITIPDSVTSIGNWAFLNCSSLTSITIPNSVTSIGSYAFYNCRSLTSITIPDSVTSIGDGAFSECSSLTSITIPDSVTSIRSSAFRNCSNLTSITIPDSVTSIGNYTFNGCSGLTSITIPDSVTSIGEAAFSNCESLTAISLSCKSSLKKSDFGGQANLVSYASHTLKKIEAKAATCTENGNIEHWTCEHCGKYFLSDDSNPETAKAVELSEITIPTIKHSYGKNGFCKNDDTHYQPASYNEESEKYEISNAGQLYWFAEQVNSGNASLNAVLTTDIVVNETVLAADGSLGADPDTLRMWYPIGDDYAENIFNGTFDGQGHTISGLYFSNDSNARDVMCASLFGVSEGIIQNVGLEDSYLNHYNISVGICAANNGQIVNCYNAGTILGYCASGICVENSDNGSIENCYNTGVIRGFGLVVGICNMNAGSMKDCYNNSDITVMTDSTIIDENDEKSYASGICNINGSSGRIENCYHVGQVSGADVNNNICNLNAGQIENSYYDCNICDKDAITQNESSAVVKNVESKTTKQFASGEVTYLLNGDQSVRAFYQNLAKEKYPTLNQKSKVVMQLEMIYDESFGEDATTNKTYHNAGDTIALETSPDKAYTYQYFVDGKQIEEPTYTLTGNTKMTVKSVPVEIELSEINTIQLTYQKKTKLDLTAYLKNFADLKPMQFQLDADSKLPEGLTLAENGILSGIPEKAAENVKTTLILTAKNGTTKNMELTFHIAKADPTVEVTVNGDSHTEGDLVSELKLILSENSTKGVVKIVSEIKALVAGKNTFTWKFIPEDENNYNMVTGTVVVNAKTTTTTTTTTKATTTTTKATTTTKPSKTTTTKVTTTTKPNKTTTTKVTTTTKPSKTTTTKATTTTKPSKTTTTKATTTTKPSKTTTTNATTTTKPSKTTTTKVTTTTKPSKTTTTNVTTTTKPNKTTTTNATTTNTAIPFYGDVNLDGKVDILDAVYLNRYLATLIQFSDAQVANADCYQDGVLNDQDTTALMQFIILLIDDLPT